MSTVLHKRQLKRCQRAVETPKFFFGEGLFKRHFLDACLIKGALLRCVLFSNRRQILDFENDVAYLKSLSTLEARISEFPTEAECSKANALLLTEKEKLVARIKSIDVEMVDRRRLMYAGIAISTQCRKIRSRFPTLFGGGS